MTKVIYCKFSPSRWKIGRRSFSKSFNEKARRGSERAISKRYSKRWRKSRKGEAIFKERKNRYAVLSKTWRNSAEASHLVSSQRRGTNLQERRHRLRARHYDGRFQRSLLDHVSPASADAGPQRQALEMRGAEEGHRQSAAASSFKDGEHSAPRRHLHRAYPDSFQPGHDRVPRPAGESLRQIRVLQERWRRRDYFHFQRRRNIGEYFRETALPRRRLHRDSARNHLPARTG